MADLNKLVEKIKADAELKKQFASAVKENKVVEFCKGLGVEITKEEIASFITIKKGELNEAELNAVNGGCASKTVEQVCDAGMSIITVGVGCGVASISVVINDAINGDPVSSCLS